MSAQEELDTVVITIRELSAEEAAKNNEHFEVTFQRKVAGDLIDMKPGTDKACLTDDKWGQLFWFKKNPICIIHGRRRWC